MMRTTFVCNASPLVFLAKIETLNFLDAYDIHVTSHVFDEITRGFEKHADDAAEILAYLNSRNISPVRVTFLANLPAFLGDGEKSVISFAVNKKIKHIFIDEAKARTVARLFGASLITCRQPANWKYIPSIGGQVLFHARFSSSFFAARPGEMRRQMHFTGQASLDKGGQNTLSLTEAQSP